MTGVNTDPIVLGSMLFTLVEPHEGHEVAYNRWYERDHFYAGCMIGESTFAGQRWVATRDLKALRTPTDANVITPDPAVGSYLALYWVLARQYDQWNRWAVDQVKELHANGRMFGERDHIHTLLYTFDWAFQRDGDAGVPSELALDHRYPGLAVVVGEAEDAAGRTEIDRWYREDHLPSALAGSPIASCLCFSPQPLLADAPGVPKNDPVEGRFMHLYFLDSTPEECWPAFAGHAKELESTGKAWLLWAGPFRPTIPGTDIYTDQL